MYRGINDFKKGYQPRTNRVKDEKSGLVADSHSILARWRNYFSQLMNGHGVNDIKQKEIHTAELLVPELSVFKFELAIEKLKSHKSLGIDPIQTEFAKAGLEQFVMRSRNLFFLIWNKEELPEEWKEKIIVPIYKNGNT